MIYCNCIFVSLRKIWSKDIQNVFYFNTIHSKYQNDFLPNSEIRMSKLQALKTQLTVQEHIFSMPIEQSKATTEAEFQK